MQTATFVIAVLGVTLSATSIGWQIAAHLLTGGRVKIELRTGAVNQTGAGMVTTPVGAPTSEWQAQHLAEQGYIRPVIAVRARNTGRLPVTVTDWSIDTSQGGMSLTPLRDSIGPSLPHRLEAGETETWAIDADEIYALVRATAKTFDIPKEQIVVRGKLSLGSGKSYTTRDSLRML